jgi:Flp pilus assembly protein TadG
MRLQRRRLPHGGRGSRGQSLVEFALVFPVFVLLLAGMIDFGVGLYSYMTVINSAREGARLGVTNCVGTTCTAAVTAKVRANASGLGPSVAVQCYTAAGVAENCTDSVSGDSVKVTSNYTYRMVWPLTFGTQIPMSSSVEMVLE